MNNEELKKLAEKLAKNPKMQKAMKGLLAPLKQKGDSITISSKNDEVKIRFEDLK